MNSLSWLIYAAQVTERLSVMAGVGAFAAGLAGGMLLLFSYDKPLIWSDTPPAEREAAFQSRRDWRKWGLRCLVAVPLFGAIAAVLPDSRTIYMIAASEAGEQIVTSPDAIEMMGDLKAIIKKRLKDELEAK